MTATQPRQPHPYDDPQARQLFLAAEFLRLITMILVLAGATVAFAGMPPVGYAVVAAAFVGVLADRYLRSLAWELTPGAQGRRSWQTPRNPARLIRPVTSALALGCSSFWFMSSMPDHGPLYVAIAFVSAGLLGDEIADLARHAITRTTPDWPVLLVDASTPGLVLTFALLTEPIANTHGWALPYAVAGALMGAVLRLLLTTLRR